MRRITSTALLALLLAGCALAAGCSKRPRAAHATHADAPHAPEPPPPTPDTTPIAILRTPAGLVLSVEETPLPPAAGPTATPAVSPAVTPGP